MDEDGYRKVVSKLDSIIDEVGEDETHPLASRLDRLAELIEVYENEHVHELALNN